MVPNAELKAQPLWQLGRVSWWCGVNIPDSVSGVTRTIGDDAVSVIANFAETATSLEISGWLGNRLDLHPRAPGNARVPSGNSWAVFGDRVQASRSHSTLAGVNETVSV